MQPVIWRVTPEELRKEAASTESLARLVSYQPDKAWLHAKADELRRLADRMEARSWLPKDRGGPAWGMADAEDLHPDDLGRAGARMKS